MNYIKNVRQFVQVVLDETNNPELVMDPSDARPSVDTCLLRFKALSDKHTDELASKTLAIATGSDYLRIADSKGKKDHRKKLVVLSEGLKLLSPLGYASAIGDVLNKFLPLVISLVAIFISVIALYHKDIIICH